jgi:hypothetical protein
MTRKSNLEANIGGSIQTRLRVWLPLCALAVFSLSFSMPTNQTFRGEIMDPQCAMDGSHAQMVSKVGLKGKDPNDPAVKKTCSDICIQMGAKYVLYDAAAKKTYQLDDQGDAKQFAGQNVKVTGTLDKTGGKIHVTAIEPGS